MNLKFGLLKSVLRHYSKMALYSAEEKTTEEIRKHLIKFPGGSVDFIKRDDGIAVVVLNHEEKKNAMSGKMMTDLYDVVTELDSWTTGKGVILKGSSGDFCSGGDLDFVKKVATAEEGFMMSTYMQKILNKFQNLPMISVALIEGVGALGGGSELSVWCDFILIGEKCKGIGFVHAKMGIVPAWGGTNRLVKKVGYTKALELLTTAKLLSPEDCVKIGLANEIIRVDENSENYALSWLQKRIRYNSDLVRCIKKSVSAASDFPGDYESERRMFAPFWGGPAHIDALKKNVKHKPES